MSLEIVLRLLIKNWRLVVLGVVVTVGFSALFVYTQKPVYRAASTVELRPNVALENPNEILNTINALTRQQVINTVARKAMSSSMKQTVAEKLNVPYAEIDNANLNAVVVPDTNLVEVRADSRDPQFAAKVSNAVAEELLSEALEPVITMEVMDVASVPQTPFEPQPKRVLMLGLGFGVLLGIAAALVEPLLRYVLSNRTFPRLEDVFAHLEPAPLAGANQGLATPAGAAVDEKS